MRNDQDIEDELWALRGQLAEQSGYLGTDMTYQALQALMQAAEPPPGAPERE